MTYTLLSERDMHQLLCERLRALEAEHYRLTLILQETENMDEREKIATDLAELDRRIELRRQELDPGDDPPSGMNAEKVATLDREG